VAKEPCGFVRQVDHAADLKGAHAFLGSHHEMRNRKPFIQRNFAALIKRSNTP
jgi:hypothetical protein